MTLLEIKKLVAVLVAAYPTNKATAETVGVYQQMLADLDYQATNAAVAQLLATSRWMPTVAEIRDHVVSLQSGEVRAGGEAWGSVRKAIQRSGRYRAPGVDFRFSDPVTHAAVKALGWVALCDSDNPTADRARFVELYDKLAVKHRRAQLSDGLPAVRRFRELQAAERRPALKTGAVAIGDVLRLVPCPGDEATEAEE